MILRPLGLFLFTSVAVSSMIIIIISVLGHPVPWWVTASLAIYVFCSSSVILANHRQAKRELYQIIGFIKASDERNKRGLN